MIIIFIVVLTIVIERFIKGSIKGGVIAAITIGVLALIYLLRLAFKGATEYLTILVIFCYNLYRLILIDSDYYIITRANHFFGGYSYAVFQLILIFIIPSTFYRIWVVVFVYLLRFGMIIFIVDSAAFQAGLLIRSAVVDVFILYFFHTDEKTERKVFLGFYQNREELLQFKELLADSLPLGVTVVDYITLKPLFSNAAFMSLFKNSVSTGPNIFQTINTPTNQLLRADNDQPEASLNTLYVDETTIRDTGKEQSDLRYENSNDNLVCFEDVLKKLIKDKLLFDKALSLTASEKSINNSRSFDMVLKRIKWNGNDAVAVVLNDITYQEKLMHWKMANANKDKIIATVSHELRTPLNGIIGLLDMTEKKIEHPEALSFISLCKDNAHLLMNLVNSLLDLHQISAGKLKLTISKINIRKCLQDVLKLFQFQANQKGIFLTLSVSEDVQSHINTDENRLKQIIINLVGNAIKFTSKGGVKILITENKEDPSYLGITVTDTGMGIQEEDKGKLFQMFGKLRDGESVNKNGVGLGLTISNALAVMLSGKKEEKEIHVASQYGKGSTFSFNILKDLKAESSTEMTEPEKIHVEFLVTENKNRVNLLKANKLNSRNNSEIQELRKSGSNEKEDVSDTSLDLESIHSKLMKYRKSLKINISDINSNSQIQDSQRLGITKKETDEINSSNENKMCFIPSQSSIQNSGREGTQPFLKRSNFSMQLTSPRGDNCILIVDDNPFNLLVAENLVRETGYPVQTAIGGYEAIKKMEEFTKKGQSIKAILMDCQMPVIDGYETSRILIEMMSQGKVTKVPILTLTANNSKEDIKRCYNSGMVGHLTKPTSKKSLTEALLNIQ